MCSSYVSVLDYVANSDNVGRWTIRSIRNCDVGKMRYNAYNLGCTRGDSRGVIWGGWYDAMSRLSMTSVRASQ